MTEKSAPTALSRAEISADVLLELKDLHTHFHTDDGLVRAVNGVDLTLRRGRTLGVVGESGCGKTILSRTVMRIVPEPPASISGHIFWHRQNGEIVDLATYPVKARQLREVRGKEISMIFQEPMSSFSPIHTIGNQIAEALLVHERVSKKEAQERTIEMIGMVGISQPDKRFHAYPFELSGGMRQRAMIAMALVCRPTLLIADEPTTALDVTVEAAILKLIKSLQAQLGMTVMIITHDLGVIAKMADDVAVMYLGKVVEQGPVEAIFDAPQHPYTRALLKSMPRLSNTGSRLEAIRGNVADPYTVLPGCAFFPRCGEGEQDRCTAAMPPLVEVGDDHLVRCVMREGVAHGRGSG
ncbi:MAG: ABC transporter ATP-binding protein [Gemmatimonadota bacterium]|nr:MAG: ABC transporter ATP-binding protein [Gemmatimonadota bacterium]